MKLTFKIHFRLHPGQSLFVCGNHPALGDGDHQKALPMQPAGPDAWQAELADVSVNETTPYQYVLRHGDGTFEMDVAQGRAIEPGWKKLRAVTVADSWNAPGFVENVFYTEPFRQVLLRRDPEVVPYSSTCARVTHQFRVRAPLLRPGQTLCLLGGSSRLGQWNTGSPILLERPAGSDFFPWNSIFPVNHCRSNTNTASSTGGPRGSCNLKTAKTAAAPRPRGQTD